MLQANVLWRIIMKVMENVKSQTDQDGATWPTPAFPSTVNAIKENIMHHLMSFQGRDPERSGARIFIRPWLTPCGT